MISQIRKQNETRRKISQDPFSMTMDVARIDTSRESCHDQRRRLSSSFTTSVDADPFVSAELPQSPSCNVAVRNEHTSLVGGTAHHNVHPSDSRNNNLNRSSTFHGHHVDRVAGTSSITTIRRRSIQIEEEVELQDLIKIIADNVSS